MIRKSHERYQKLFWDGWLSKEMVDKEIETWDNIKAMKKVEQICEGHSELIDLLNKCLEIDPNKRINCSNALKHPYFNVKYES